MEFKILIALILLTVVTITVSEEICGICGAISHAACYNSTHFALCDEDLKPTWDEGACPSGLVCSNDERICVSEGSIHPCTSPCGTCTNDRFACKSNLTFSLCFGQGTPSEMEFACPYGKVCSTIKHIETQSADYCFYPETLQPYHIDCNQNFVPVVPTPPPTINPTQFCRSQNKAGLFVNIKDSFRKSYYNCRYEGGKLIGSIEKCPLLRTFDANRRICA